ncbi:MAG: amidohydrolase family protein [Candidatus Aramenus sp.]|jgi:cytosine deaminase|nr:amidohydrolase family protein [Candidatus Aramenus sp.]
MIIKNLRGAVKAIRVEGGGSINAEGRIALPAFYDMHFHPENAFTLELTGINNSSTLSEAVEKWSKLRDSLTVEEIKERMKKALLLELYNGVTHVRVHADTCSRNLKSLKAAVLLKEEIGELMDVQVVAFPEQGILKCENDFAYASQLADVVGGKPEGEEDFYGAVAHMDYVMEMAKKLGKTLDVHVDQQAKRTRFAEYMLYKSQVHLTLSHLSSLHYEDEQYVKRIIKLIKSKNATVISAPLTNLYLAGDSGYPKGRGITRIREMMSEGVNVCLGNDDVQNVFYPFGAGDILLSLFMAVNLEQAFDVDEWIKLVTVNAEKEFSRVSVPGKDYVILDAKSVREQLSTLAPRFMVIRKGRVVATTNREAKLVVDGSTIDPISLLRSLTS